MGRNTRHNREIDRRAYRLLERYGCYAPGVARQRAEAQAHRRRPRAESRWIALAETTRDLLAAGTAETRHRD